MNSFSSCCWHTLMTSTFSFLFVLNIFKYMISSCDCYDLLSWSGRTSTLSFFGVIIIIMIVSTIAYVCIFLFSRSVDLYIFSLLRSSVFRCISFSSSVSNILHLIHYLFSLLFLMYMTSWFSLSVARLYTGWSISYWAVFDCA
jgi:hypothetical protein